MNRIARAMLNIAVAVAVTGSEPEALSQSRGPVPNSLLLLIDASGSIGDTV